MEFAPIVLASVGRSDGSLPPPTSAPTPTDAAAAAAAALCGQSGRRRSCLRRRLHANVHGFARRARLRIWHLLLISRISGRLTGHLSFGPLLFRRKLRLLSEQQRPRPFGRMPAAAVPAGFSRRRRKIHLDQFQSRIRFSADRSQTGSSVRELQRPQLPTARLESSNSAHRSLKLKLITSLTLFAIFVSF